MNTRFKVVLAVMAGAALASVMAAAASPDAATPAVPKAPAFDAKQLTTPPTDSWVTNGGTVFNQRFSPLTLINRDNVSGLKALWRTGMGSGMSQGNSGQAQILEYGGVVYLSNGASDAFAIDVETGRILWEYRANLDPKSSNPIGRSSRGLALGDGKVFLARLDGDMVALDQRSGKIIWQITAEPWQTGFNITPAPLYYNGLVITGFNGGEMGTRGRLKAFDAKTGKLAWTFYTIPAPGEPGSETWPKNDAWLRGGGSVWQTPAVDPELGLIYFTTGNPGPDLHGIERPGDNLFTVSVVAIDARTGKYRWHFQQVHHDIWDYDSPNPVVLFDTQINGKPVKGLVEVSKTGWAYILDRVTGKPLIGIEERPVPQEPRQATAATQPFPIGDPIVPHEIDNIPDGANLPAGATELPNKGRIFTPFWTDPVMVKPGTFGGANWPPSSYDPQSHLLYVCATDRVSVFKARDPIEAYGPNKVYMGGAFTQANVNDRGVFAAVDVTTNKIAWRREWREICYSGSIVTAGGLVFVGRADGRLTALDSRNGNQLWEFMTDAGVNTTATTFEHKGKQYVVVHAGGGVFANAKRGDGVWMFSLDGKIDPVKPQAGPPQSAAAAARAGGAAGAGGAGGGPGVGAAGGALGAAGAGAPAASHPLNKANGAKIYVSACVPCHGESGEGGHGGGPTLVKGVDEAKLESVTSSGRNNMPSFSAVYAPDDIRDVARYILEDLAKKK